jgi:hypothetical protein
MPAQVNITAETDQDFYQIFQYLLPDGVTPIPIIGATFVMKVRRSAGDTGVLFAVTSTLPSAGQIQIYDGPNGKFSVWIAQAQLLAAPIGTWSHSCTITMVQPNSGIAAPLTLPMWGSTSTFTIAPGASR